MSWPKTIYNGKEYSRAEGIILMDPETGAAIIMVRPEGGFGAGITAIETGPPGRHAEISEAINFTPLAPTDPSPGSASFTQLSPATDEAAAVYKLNLALRTGQKGDTGDAAPLDPADYAETPVAKQMLVVNSEETGFELIHQRFLGRHYPVSISNAAAGDTNKTVAIISIPANTYPVDFRVELEAQTIITATGPDCRVDLVAHLGSTSGNDIGRCFGIGGAKDRLLIAGGAAYDDVVVDAWDKQDHTAVCNIYVVTEKQGGADNYTTSIDTTRVKAKVYAV